LRPGRRFGSQTYGNVKPKKANKLERATGIEPA
jgi:hypothetical protein